MSAQRGARRPGIALLTALVVVMLLTMFLSELFFATGMELRSLEAFRNSTHARRLARSTLKATQIGLLQDEVEFFRGYRQMQLLMQLSSVPLEGGLLVTLDITPVDSLYNLNDVAGKNPEGAEIAARFEVFQNLMAQIKIPAEDPSQPAGDLQEVQVSQIFAALMDWLDGDETVNAAPDGTAGAESGAYASEEPEYLPRNGILERLEEVRLAQGFREAKVPWTEFSKRFVVRAKATGTNLYAEKLNANLAPKQEIAEFLQARAVTSNQVLNDPTFGTVQKELNKYAERALDIADALVPEGQERPIHTDSSIKSALTAAGVNSNVSNQVFSSISQYYRVVITTEVGDIQAHLTALVFVNRKADRTATSAEVQQFFLD